MKARDKGITMMILGFVFSILETGYFGWNMTPQSNAEVVCDIASLIMFFSGWIVLALSDNDKTPSK